MMDFYSTKAFENEFTYSGTDLGAVWTEDKTAFRLWAPTAEEISVILYESGTKGTEDEICRLPMKRDKNGTWTAEKFGNLHGTYYTYLVTVDGKTAEVCDPYAKTTGVNGHRAMILDLSSVNPRGWESDRDPHGGCAVTDAVIYELHVRDISMDAHSGIRNKGKFLGLAERGTHTENGVPTGLAHIQSLGVTHVQLLPIFDFGYTDERAAEPRYNWGYDPVNFNVPEGSYSTDPYHGEVRVRELKQMIQGLHSGGVSVVMDVVYNHVYDAEKFCMNRIVPEYFSRGSSDGSCCGNDTATERSMVRKYIVDSVNFWAEEYHIDGFRFDLAGLMDTKTIAEIVKTVRKNHPNVIFYGEGWSLNTRLTKPRHSLCTQKNAAKVPDFAFFSDEIRDILRGSVFDSTLTGFVSGAVCARDALNACFLGAPAWAAAPTQTVNYVSCHDNHTLFDRISLSAPEDSRETRIKRSRLAGAFSVLSQGIPFFLAGEEMLRSKPADGGFDHNSYRASDSVNALRWQDLEKVEYAAAASYYRGLLAFRKAHPSLRLESREAVQKTVRPLACENPHTCAFLLEGERDERIFVAFHAENKEISMPLPDGKWQICIRGSVAGTESLGQAEGTVALPPLSALVLTQKAIADL